MSMGRFYDRFRRPGGRQIDGTRSVVTRCNAVCFASPQYGWIAGDRGMILATNDGGESWHLQDGRTSCDFKSIFFLDTRHGWAVGTQGVIIATNDGGRVWKVQLRTEIGVLKSIRFVNPNCGWAIGGVGHIVWTQDGGQNWQSLNALEQVGLVPRATFLRSIAFVDVNRGFIVGETKRWPLQDRDEDEGETTVMLETSNGGLTWKRRDPQTPGILKSVSFAGPSTGWSAGTQLFTTRDGGCTWARMAGPNADLINSICFRDSQVGWAVGPSHFHRTVDGGLNWERTNCPPITYLKSIRFAGNNIVWAVGIPAENASRQCNGIYVSHDGGQNWNEIVLYPISTDQHLYLSHRFPLA